MDIKLGEMNLLKVVKAVDFGVYLDGGEQAGEILLPTRYVPEGCQPGDELNVFLYLDQEERLIATTLVPKAKVGDFAYLKSHFLKIQFQFQGVKIPSYSPISRIPFTKGNLTD